MHRCDVPACVNPAHLVVGTQAQNNADRDTKERARHQRGEDHHAARLTADKVREIRRRVVANGEPQAEVAQVFGVTQSTVGRICRREGWAHVG
jgi:hypothetical protein